jgi:phosphotransferase system HPr (HPr) family protein
VNRISQCIDIVNPLGLHLRAAHRFVSLAREFRAEVSVSVGGRVVNGKSILDLATLGAGKGTVVHLEVNGPEAEAALGALVELMRRGFDELENGPTSSPPGDDELTQAAAAASTRDEVNVSSEAERSVHRLVPVLIVEDDEDTAETLSRILSMHGYSVQVARDGHHAIALARVHRPQTVLLDIGLPDLNGFQVATRLREELADPVTIIAITGYGGEEDRRRVREAKIDFHLLKPAALSELLLLIPSPRFG